jgi:hypothetical protein
MIYLLLDKLEDLELLSFLLIGITGLWNKDILNNIFSIRILIDK